MSGRTGTVFLENFDIGLVETFGAELVDIELDGEMVQDYALRVSGVEGPLEYNGMIPVVFQSPEEVYQNYYLPHIAVFRSSVVPANQRWHPGGREYLIPAASARQIPGADGQLHPNRMEMKHYCNPYDITYDMHLRARRRQPVDLMLRYICQYYPPYGVLFCVDSEGATRGYDAFQESIDNLDEVADISERVIGHTLSIRVEAELDFQDPFIVKATPNLGTNTEPL